MDTELSKVLTYCERLSLLKPYDFLIKAAACNFKNLYLHFHKTYGHFTWQGLDFDEEVQHEDA